ncbi:hypothetical protein SBOR_1505 [Sclerotinia borealis F-4128]|uniref:2EXR domain-containing protein n=1 Tax=Sclerotinia borealis (strain F-4128) TaxID=1432307 RepID=W9CQJ9_SCLBF|nr:hypothetical protein SBOR_1505 [Sclerotinia borealis F-4128]
MEAQITQPCYIPLSQRYAHVWKDTERKFNAKQIEKASPKPPFISECEYQVESSNIGDLLHPPPSPALSFEQLFEGFGHGTTNDKLGVSPTNFTRFEQLPAELRLEIWRMACGQGRNIKYEMRPFGTQGECVCNSVSNTPEPGVLSACKESREEALKHYSLCLGTKADRTTLRLEAQRRIWFNSKVDTMCVGLDFSLYCIGARSGDFFTTCATMSMSSLAFNIYQRYSWGEPVWEVDWNDIFRAIDAYGARSSELQEIILYYDMDIEPEYQWAGSEFVELDWSAMDPYCEKMNHLQTVQRELLRDSPGLEPDWRAVTRERMLEIWGNIQSKVILMDVKVNNDRQPRQMD